MARPLRLEFAGALYHVTSRGDRQENIYLEDTDRETFLDVLSVVCNRFNWTVHAYCLMTNHYHLLIETPEANLSQGMRQLNGFYIQSFRKIGARNQLFLIFKKILTKGLYYHCDLILITNNYGAQL